MNSARNTAKALGSTVVALSLMILAGNAAPMCGTGDQTPELTNVCEIPADCEGLDHAECTGEWSCEEAVCIWKCENTDPEVYCFADDECSEGQYCTVSDGDCFLSTSCGSEDKQADPAIGAPCGGCMGVCKDKIVQPELCMSDADCLATEYCSVADGDCLAAPGCNKADQAGEAMNCLAVCYGECRTKTVDPSECDEDADCGEGKRCEFVDCHSAPCAEGMECEAKCAPVGKCVDVCSYEGLCLSDAECAEGQRCTVNDCTCIDPCGGFSGMAEQDRFYACYGNCVPNDEPPPSECEIDTDCPQGWFCQVECWAPPCDENTPCMDMCMPIGKCIPPVDPPECSVDTDCGPGYYCQIESWCGEKAEESDPATEPCLPYGFCVPLSTGCTSDGECPDGMYCYQETICSDCAPYDDGSYPEDCMGGCYTVGTCSYKISGCSSDSECGAGYYCSIQEVCPPCDYAYGSDPAEGAMMPPPCDGTVSCTYEGVCLPVEYPNECYADSDCGPGYYCSIEYLCPPCADGTDCDMMCLNVGTCVPAQSECYVDSDCGPGYFCELFSECGTPCQNCLIACPLIGTCKPIQSACSSDADCAQNEYCELTCLATPMPCNPETGCGEICTGLCVPKSTEFCTSDAECPDGFYCKSQEVCYDECDPADPSVPCTGTCWIEGQCWPDSNACQGMVCAVGEVMDFTTCTCVPQGKCMITGCSGEICADVDTGSMCIWQDWYVCLAEPYTTCGPFGPNGECMWQPTVELTNCLAHF